MMNLFSPFNPATNNHLSLNWFMVIMPMLFYLLPFWALMSKSLMLNKMLTKSMIPQFKSSMSKINSPNLIIVNTIMMMILMYNLLSLMPNTFPTTSHIVINLSMALILWLALMEKKINNPLKLMSNLTPSNTPTILIPFMVMIELVSIIIQPMTLSIRLTANITAGHIMMTLVSKMYMTTLLPTLVMNMMMMILELGVSLIQSYVFVMLIIMYDK